MCDLYLVRHGETVGESSIRFYGKTDIALSDMGRLQMRRAGEALRSIDFKSAVVSPLGRSIESAAIILEGRKAPEPAIEPGFAEINFGLWEGWTEEEIAEQEPELHHMWRVDGVDFRFPEGDKKSEFFDRIARTARRRFEQSPSPALAVLHKGVIKGILSELLQKPLREIIRMPIELGGISRLERLEDGKWRIASSNETAHLTDCRIEGS